MKKGELTLVVLADYSKAFDTVSYSTIIQKMYKMGFSKPFLSWMTNNLCDRFQYLQSDDTESTLEHLQFGVPQGSILGPLLFNIYTADLQDNLSGSISCYQYADDTTLYKHCARKISRKMLLIFIALSATWPTGLTSLISPLIQRKRN